MNLTKELLLLAKSFTSSELTVLRFACLHIIKKHPLMCLPTPVVKGHRACNTDSELMQLNRGPVTNKDNLFQLQHRKAFFQVCMCTSKYSHLCVETVEFSKENIRHCCLLLLPSRLLRWFWLRAPNRFLKTFPYHLGATRWTTGMVASICHSQTIQHRYTSMNVTIFCGH